MFEHPWNPVKPDGTYRNPIIFSDYSDPDVIRHGNDFYMVSSSFNCTPGVPILHSTDLVYWRLINHAIKNLPHPRYKDFVSGSGVWAPSIRFNNGLFYIFIPLVEDGIYVTTARDPAAEWSEPYLLCPGKGLIDPCPFWDDDGKAYMVHAYARSRSGLRDKIHMRPMSPDATEMLGEGKIVFDQGERHPYMEGPKMHKRDGYYYIFAPAGGVPTGWQAVLRSKEIYGVYEDRIVLEQGSTAINGPHQGALVELANGEEWFIHFQDANLYGRIVHMQPVTWKEGWPVMGVDYDSNGVGEPVAHWKLPSVGKAIAVGGDFLNKIPQTTDLFNGSKLGLQWQWNANHEDDWVSLKARPGHLRFWVKPQPCAKLQECSALLLQKFPTECFSVETEVEAGFVKRERAGLIIVGAAYGALVIRENGDKFIVALESSGESLWEKEWPTNRVRVRVDVAVGGECSFSCSEGAPDSKWFDVPIIFTAQQAEWIGARVGLFAATANSEATEMGYADFGPVVFGGLKR